MGCARSNARWFRRVTICDTVIVDPTRRCAVDCLEFSGLIASRLCHDLAGPIGVLANGAELLADETDEAVRAEFVALIGAGATTLAARLRLLRTLFADGSDLAIPQAAARTVLAGWLAADARVTLEWRETDATLARPFVRLLLALAMIAAEALERGGLVTVHCAPEGWQIDATGPDAALATEEAEILGGAAASVIGSRAAIAHLAAALVRKLAIELTVVEHVGEVQFRLLERAGAERAHDMLP